ncbi:putative UDP-Glycosyltransferase superfamily protein [Tripterygium wilfordii]|uniref:Putative UDP-Glycosyltransferase superfamily protein n=1 Tax=Tripterygium wilfordii TaxID=458696 RepID=A0A7J7DXB5_TRIWF|nr:putative UDP-Glycosyltransferase superfamily protein [Tripterygium wilfordii]
MATYFSVSLNMLQCKTEEKEFSLPDFPEAAKIQLSQLGNDLKFTDGTDAGHLFRVRHLTFCLRSDAILLNSIEGLGQTVELANKRQSALTKNSNNSFQ